MKLPDGYKIEEMVTGRACIANFNAEVWEGERYYCSGWQLSKEDAIIWAIEREVRKLNETANGNLGVGVLKVVISFLLIKDWKSACIVANTYAYKMHQYKGVREKMKELGLITKIK